MVSLDQLQCQCSRFSLKGVSVPLYRLGSNSGLDDGSVAEEQSLLDSVLLAHWEDRMWKGLFRYDVTASEIKVIGGRRKFIAQFNERWSADCVPKPGRSKIGRGVFELWMDCQEELLFSVARGAESSPELVLAADVPDSALLITVNVSAIEYGHVFLIPYCSNILYQFLDAKSLELALRVAVEVKNYSFRLFYDFSPGASHIYFQACYFQSPLPVEFMPSDTLFIDGQKKMCISSVVDYPIKTLVFESNHFEPMLEVVAEICSCLQGKLILYNLLVSDNGRKIFLFLQQHTSKTSFTLSAWECGGYFLFKSRSAYDQATEMTLLKQLSTVSIDKEGFEAVKLMCRSIASKFTS
ncbi:GDP-L-galactose phosphorylase 1-like [Argentina anserina]|uniref:GDP-L-galactose phosphorylase 1-like n=1 Tax=Argentina anserina TaxID=57926 RepID=UPI00217632B4|nr:GDP-L-galactose phosphorylase 1-like [Potentilla anserina]